MPRVSLQAVICRIFQQRHQMLQITEGSMATKQIFKKEKREVKWEQSKRTIAEVWDPYAQRAAYRGLTRVHDQTLS